MWNLQPLPPPDPLDALEVDDPAGISQYRRDAAISVAAILGGERDDVGGQSRLVIGRLRPFKSRYAVHRAERHSTMNCGLRCRRCSE
jgi:hypothetical protein